MRCVTGMADTFVNWPPPVEALIPLVEALARAQAKADFERGQAFLRGGRWRSRSFSPADPEGPPPGGDEVAHVRS
jgi:hypothetical protein